VISARTRAAVCAYIDHASAERVALRCTLDQLAEALPGTAVFGGMLREFGWGEARRFSSDIDLVTRSTRAEIHSAIRRHEPVLNKFGGYRFVAARRSFDIWSLEDTWAFREGLVPGRSMSDLLCTTFFHADAAYLDLKTRRLQHSPGFALSMVQRTLEINLAHNPAPHRMVARAIRMAIDKQAAIGPALAVYMVDHACAAATNLERSFLAALREHVERDVGTAFSFQPQRDVPLMPYPH
jgi:hypothetical protein